MLQAALDRAPQNATLKGELIRVEAEIGGIEAGLAKARDFAKADPGNPSYDLVSAELLDKAGRGKEAATLLEKALAAKPADDGLTAGLAEVYSHDGAADKAETLLNARLKAAPNDYALRADLGVDLSRMQKIMMPRLPNTPSSWMPDRTIRRRSTIWPGSISKKVIWQRRGRWPNGRWPRHPALPRSTTPWDGSCWPKAMLTRR